MFAELCDRLKKWDVRVYFSDCWSAYSSLIPPGLLVQAKAETRLTENNNFPQRHWFAGFRRKTCCVSRSLEMIDLTIMLYAKHHVNGNMII
jgi:insertion element IS1 protein InsB